MAQPRQIVVARQIVAQPVRVRQFEQMMDRWRAHISIDQQYALAAPCQNACQDVAGRGLALRWLRTGDGQARWNTMIG